METTKMLARHGRSFDAGMPIRLSDRHDGYRYTQGVRSRPSPVAYQTPNDISEEEE